MNNIELVLSREYLENRIAFLEDKNNWLQQIELAYNECVFLVELLRVSGKPYTDEGYDFFLDRLEDVRYLIKSQI